MCRVSNSGRVALRALLALLFIAAPVGCDGQDPVKGDLPKTVVLGFDGVDPDFLARWMKAGKLPNLKPEEIDEIENMTVRIVNKILHRPMNAIKDHARERKGRQLAELVRKLFDIRRPMDPD